MIDLLDAIGVPRDALAATPQDPRFHAEGDVWTHTQMAVAELVASSAYAATAADPIARAILVAGVLFHDIGKPATTRTDIDAAITSRGHPRRRPSTSASASADAPLSISTTLPPAKSRTPRRNNQPSGENTQCAIGA